MTTIATVGSVNSTITTRTYDGDGNAGWTAAHGTNVNAVCFDSGGNVYTGGNRPFSNITTRKYDGTGNLLWSADHGSVVRGIALHPAGVVAAGNRTSSVTTRLYDSDGGLTWSRDYLGGTVYCVAADSSSNVYVGGARTSSITTAKYNSSGTLQWSADHGLQVNGIAVDSSGNVYTAGVGNSGSSNYTTRKYNSSGTLQWSIKHDTKGPSTVYCIAVDSDGNVYTGGNVVSGSPAATTRKYDTDGNLIWSVNHGAFVYGIAVDSDGNVYTGGNSNGTYTTRKYDSSGNLQWSVFHGLDVFGIAVLSPSELPALAIGFSLGIPTAGFSSAIPALSFNLKLATPTATPQPIPPDLTLVVGDYSTIYRLLITGKPDPLEVKLISLQCRRRLGQSTWLDVVTEYTSQEQFDEIVSRVGGELVVYSGTVDSSGHETTGQFIRAVLTEYRNEITPRAGTIQLTGRVVPVAFSATTMVLSGVSKKGKDTAGRKTARCSVDFLLRPNDTVNDGSSSWLAGSILYFISPFESWMDVVEVNP